MPSTYSPSALRKRYGRAYATHYENSGNTELSGVWKILIALGSVILLIIGVCHYLFC